jgi:hypothetical protein
MQTIGVISNSLAEMEIQNTTYFNIVKNIILENELFEKSIEAGEEIPRNVNLKEKSLKPLDCAHFMAAFCKVKLFDGNLDLFEYLERQFVKYID